MVTYVGDDLLMVSPPPPQPASKCTLKNEHEAKVDSVHSMLHAKAVHVPSVNAVFPGMYAKEDHGFIQVTSGSTQCFSSYEGASLLPEELHHGSNIM